MTVFVEGLIGAGKSTLLSELGARGFPVVPEPVDDWLPLVEAAEKTPHTENIFRLQRRCFETHHGVQHPEDAYVERSATVAAVMFLEPNCDRLSTYHSHALRGMYARRSREETMDAKNSWVFLDTSPETAADRVAERGRAAESSLGITRQYEHLRLLNEAAKVLIHVVGAGRVHFVRTSRLSPSEVADAVVRATASHSGNRPSSSRSLQSV